MLKNLPQKVKIVEVGPRDGLQNEKLIVPTEDKVKFILLLGESGLKNIEVTSFVRPDRIPQMTDAKQVIEALQKTDLTNTVNLSCLIPNLKGLEAASKLGVKEIAVFSSTSDTFNKKNINSTVEESLTIIRPVVKEALKLNIRVRAYISTVFGCPYEGKPKSLDTLKRVVDFFVEAGAYELSLSDTIGHGNPKEVVSVLESLKDSVDRKNLAMHMHDTRGLALSNILTGLEMGISTFDGSSGGLGGCPYAKGASGNCATEELVYLFESMGISTGVDINKLKEASSFALEKLERKSPSKFLQAYKS
ncbi:MAG: hydroxymethylglutaryl-CoA lyase [Bdellovibrionota bacterium]|nr:hydroxymethylglutaryl-CoA lyase [Bdellovibrionota bacterium]